MYGPKPQPTKLKVLHGNPGKRKINDREPHPEVQAPEPPDFLSPEALEEWNFIAPQLEGLGLLSKIDHAALEAYCVAYGRWRKIEGILRDGEFFEEIDGVFTVKPAVWIANKAMYQMRQLLAEFGMTPSSRSRIAIDIKKNNKNEYEKWKSRTKAKEA